MNKFITVLFALLLSTSVFANTTANDAKGKVGATTEKSGVVTGTEADNKDKEEAVDKK